jgi:hypothetical protein
MLTPDVRPACCTEAEKFESSRMGIFCLVAPPYTDAPDDLAPGWYLAYDSWYESVPIRFCPFCGKGLA